MLLLRQNGGAIHQTTWATSEFNGFATFEKNWAWNVRRLGSALVYTF